jgi:hypothetical protein
MSQTITAQGGAQIATANPKFGTGAFLGDGSGDFLQVTDSASMEPGSGDFTIDFWMYPTTEATRQALYHWSNGADWSLAMDFNSVALPDLAPRQLSIWASSNGSSWNLMNGDNAGNGRSGFSLTLNTYQHIAHVRSGTDWYLFVDGVQKLHLTGIAGAVVDNGGDKDLFSWFTAAAMAQFTGNIDEFRYSNIARWTSGFTPPAAAYTTDANTMMLLHMDGTNGSTVFTDSSDAVASTFSFTTLLKA